MRNEQDETLDLGSWFILRCASVDTLKLADQLRKRGHDVWTPIQRKRGKRPRTRTTFDKEFAVLPSYVFANTHDLPGIARLATIPTADTVRFTLFRTLDGGLPLIDDNQLAALRWHEEKLQKQYEAAIRKGIRAPRFNAGHTVTLSGGGFDGLEATVIEHKGQFALVDIPGFAEPVKIASLLLLEDGVCDQPKAVKAA